MSPEYLDTFWLCSFEVLCNIASKIGNRTSGLQAIYVLFPSKYMREILDLGKLNSFFL